MVVLIAFLVLLVGCSSIFRLYSVLSSFVLGFPVFLVFVLRCLLLLRPDLLFFSLRQWICSFLVVAGVHGQIFSLLDRVFWYVI